MNTYHLHSRNLNIGFKSASAGIEHQGLHEESPNGKAELTIKGDPLVCFKGPESDFNTSTLRVLKMEVDVHVYVTSKFIMYMIE